MSSLIPGGNQHSPVQGYHNYPLGEGQAPRQPNSVQPLNPGIPFQLKPAESNSSVEYASHTYSSAVYNPIAGQNQMNDNASHMNDTVSFKVKGHPTRENDSLLLNCPPGISSMLCNSPMPMQNGPYVNSVGMMNQSVPASASLNGSYSENLTSAISQLQFSSPVPMSPSGSQLYSRQLPASGLIPNQSAGEMNLRPTSYIKTVPPPDSSSVPFAGLSLPYNNQKVTASSPQVTPGPSQTPSARSSRNPSPISAHRYDYMEGQFSNNPSPSNSSPNFLKSSGHSSMTPKSAQYSPNSNAVNNSSSNLQCGTQFSRGYGAMPVPSQIPTLSPVVSQPTQHNSMMNSDISPSLTNPRYPQKVAYNNVNQSLSPAMTSQPGNFLPPNPMYHELPDGPVGGISHYDPKLHARMSGTSVNSSFSRLWGNEDINLLQDRNILPALPLEPPQPVLPVERANCSSKIFRSTLTKVPESSSLLQKSRLPFGILIHPFRDVSNLPVIQCNTIVRCRNCRTYINPFVTFVDQRRWQCNLCYRPNDLPEEFLYDPVTRSYGEPARRPEIKNATIEFIAPSDYTLRPPQPAVYLFVLDVSHSACEIGYLPMFCETLMEQLNDLPGDSRTKVGFITFDGSIHFYNLAEGLNQPHMLIISDIDDVFLPSPDSLLVNLQESKALICDLLQDLPNRFASNCDSNCCLGSALQVAYKLMSPVGGRVTVIQTSLPNSGPGLLKNREDPNQRAAKDISNVGPANDFYKKLALECSSQQVAVDLFLLSSQYIDISTISCISKYSSGCVQYYPGFHYQKGKMQVDRFSSDLKRYLSRRIGFEAVMRIRCTRGLSIHTFHGNFFVRSTDLLSLPNVNPDIGFAMQIAIEETLSECNSVSFQAAVLYTSSNGERRIRVHTLSLPVVSMLSDVWGGADQEAIVGLVSKMAVDRSVISLSDARDALINVCIDLLGAFKSTSVSQSSQNAGILVAPYSARLIPLFILALLKHVAFRTGVSTKLDNRVYAMERMKTLPLQYLMKYIYPTLYPVHSLDDKNCIHQDDDVVIPQPVILQLSSEKVDRHGAYVLDSYDTIYLYICQAVNDSFCQNCLGVPNFSAIPEDLVSLPELHTPESERLRTFISWLQEQRPSSSPFKVIREDSNARLLFLQYMLDDRTESLFSYYEFLQHLRQQVSK